MSWEEFQAYREGLTKKRKRRRLFPSDHEPDVKRREPGVRTALPKKRDPQHVLKDCDLENSFNNEHDDTPSYSGDVIASFDSDEQSPVRPKRALKQKTPALKQKTPALKQKTSALKQKTPAKGKCSQQDFPTALSAAVNRSKSRSKPAKGVFHPRTPTRSTTRTLDPTSPLVIDSFESDSSASAIEATPPTTRRVTTATPSTTRRVTIATPSTTRRVTIATSPITTATPPMKIDMKFRKFSERDLPAISDDEDEGGLQPGSMFQHTQKHKKTSEHVTRTTRDVTRTTRDVTKTTRDVTQTTRDVTRTPRDVTKTPRAVTMTTEQPGSSKGNKSISVKTVKLGATTPQDFRNQFSDFTPRAVTRTTRAVTMTTEETPSKASAASWLKSIKSPERKPAEEEDRSAKKSHAKKHAVGTWAHRAQSLTRFNRGEYLMWLHKNIASSNKPPPFNEFCFYGKPCTTTPRDVTTTPRDVTTTPRDVTITTGCNFTFISTTSCDRSHRSVVVMIPDSQKCGLPGPDKTLVVFPPFHCSVRGSEHILLSMFHAQFFESSQFSAIPKSDHFVGVQESVAALPLVEEEEEEGVCYIPVTSIVAPSSPVDLYLCVYHVRHQSSHLQFLCLDVLDNPVLVEIELRAAQQLWDQIALGSTTSCHFTSLKLCHVAPALSCYSWFPQLKLLRLAARSKLYCFEQIQGSVALRGDLLYNEAALARSYRARQELTCRYLRTVPCAGEGFVTYVVTMLGTLQWVKHSSPLQLPHRTQEHSSPLPPSTQEHSSIKYTGLLALHPHCYQYDVLSSYSICTTAHLLDPQYPYLYTILTEEEMQVFEGYRATHAPYSTSLPPHAPCAVALTIASVAYSATDKQFTIRGTMSGVEVAALVFPATVRRLLGASNIAECELARLRGTLFRCRGVVVRQGLIKEVGLGFV